MIAQSTNRINNLGEVFFRFNARKASEETRVLEQAEQRMTKNIQLPLTVEAEVREAGFIKDTLVR